MVHGCMVYTDRADTAAVSRGTSHASAVSTPLRWIFKKSCSRVKSRASAVSLLESGEQSYIKAINDNSPIIVQELCESRGGRPGLSVLTSLLVFVDVKIY